MPPWVEVGSSRPAVATFLVGVFLLIGWPYTALWVTDLLLGVNLLITGAMNIAFASKAGTSKWLRRPGSEKKCRGQGESGGSDRGARSRPRKGACAAVPNSFMD